MRFQRKTFSCYTLLPGGRSRGREREPLRSLWNDLGRGYVSGVGYYVFTDRGGDRIERAALGPSGYMLNESGAYDLIEDVTTANRVLAELEQATRAAAVVDENESQQ